MSLQRLRIPHLMGGVSQLPQEQRQLGTVERLENGLIDPVHGLRKRPPSEVVGTISSSQTGYDEAFLYAIDRKDDERYIVVVANGTVKVFDAITAEECTVAYRTPTDYLQKVSLPVGEANRGFRAMSVGDHTFIVNRDVTVRRGIPRSSDPVQEALIFIRQADPGVRYIVSVNGVNFNAQTFNAEEGTDVVASRLYAIMEPSLPDYTLQRFGSTVYIKRNDGQAFSLNARDSLGDKAIRIVYGKVDGFEGLPARAKDGMIVEVALSGAGASTARGSVWVKYTDTGDTEGVWEECLAPGRLTDLDASTMPHELVREGRYTELLPAVALKNQPSQKVNAGTTYLDGWTKNQADTVINSDQTQNVEMAAGGSTTSVAIRTDAISGSSDTLTRDVTIAYDVDASTARTGTGFTVTLQANTGSGWTDVASKGYLAGTVAKDETFTTTMLCPVGTRFALKLDVKTSFWTVPTASRSIRVVGHGTSQDTPGVKVQERPSQRINIGNKSTLWPGGMVVSFKLDGVSFTYTLPSGMTSDALATALAAYVDAHASFVSAVSAPTLFGFFSAVGIDVTNASGLPPVVTDLAYTFDGATQYFNPTLSMTPGEHVGRTIRNFTDNSEGVITANTDVSITVSSLSGGHDNTFAAGDECAVNGVGSAFFVFQQAPWGERLVGDDKTSPFPSFTDQRISDVFFYAGRLGFLANDAVVTSAISEPYRFFRQTVSQVLPGDPIDIRSAHKDVGLLDSAVEWNEMLLVCSSAGHQLSFTGTPVLTAETVRLDHLSSYPQADKIRPLLTGESVLFPRKASGYTQVREMFRTQDGGFDSRSLTDHCSRYILGDIVDCTSDPDIGVSVFRSDGDTGKLYVLTKWTEGKTPVNAWQSWTFGTRIVGAHFSGGALYLVIYRGSAVKLEKIEVAVPDYSANHRDNSTVPYTFLAELNTPYLLDGNGMPITHGRTQVRTMDVMHHENGYYRIETELPLGRGTRTYATTTSFGKTRVPVLTKNDEGTIQILNDQPQGCGISSVEFELTYSDRSR